MDATKHISVCKSNRRYITILYSDVLLQLASYLIYNTIFPTGMNNTEQALSAKVLHQYKPQTKEELYIYPGDIISEVVMLEQGWCRVRFHYASQ